MRAIDVIRTKRDGQPLSPEAIQSFVNAATTGSWEDYQLTALLMAIWLRGMTPEETALLTKSMTESGRRFRWDDIPGPKADKHSTGGVGDKTSLIIAPVAACRDPKDDKFLALAASGGAQAIVSSDDDLLSMGSFEGVVILSPRRFLEAVSPS